MYEKPLNRREFLKQTSITTGITALGVQPVHAETTDPEAKVRFVEVGIEHALQSSDVSGSPPKYPIDEPVRHAVDTSNNAVYLKKSMPDEVVSLVKRGKQVVKVSGSGYHSFTTAVLGDTPTRAISTRLGEHYRQLQAMILDEEYRLPAIDVQKGPDDDVVLTVNRSKTVIPTGSERDVVLEPKDVTATFSVVTDERVSRQGVPSRKEPLRQERTTETVTVTPTVKVRNYGKMDVMDTTYTNAPL